MKFICLLLLFFSVAFNSFTQNNLPYPVIFVHGLTGSDETFGVTMEYLSTHDSLGNVNVFDVVLNADNDNTSALLLDDVQWQDFTFNGSVINVGRRNYDSDVNNFVDGWTGSNLFAVNFKEERIRGAYGTANDYFDQSNESGIFKQGFALGKMIEEVLSYTGADKIILIGHSMGGLAIREYLQRRDINSIPINWVNPMSINGHKVARVATYGTPHVGSNTSPDPTKYSEVPNPLGYSEANRDMLWEYNSFTQCPGPSRGLYMFGGNEVCIQSISSNSTFPNVDINCNGFEGDNIVGINEGYYSYDFNPNMPLPSNIDYTYMCSLWANWGSGLSGDGAVSIHRQWLHVLDTPSPQNLADTTMNSIPHTSEGADFRTIIRGMDEPEVETRAFSLEFDKKYIGYITYQMNMEENDWDVFKVSRNGINSFEILLESDSSEVLEMSIYDQNLVLLNNFHVSSAVQTFSILAVTDTIYIKIYGKATSTSWQHPYRVLLTPLTYVGLGNSNVEHGFSVYPNPATEKITIETIFKNYQIDILSCDGKLINTSNNTNSLSVENLPKGIYFIQLLAENKRFVKRIIIN